MQECTHEKGKWVEDFEKYRNMKTVISKNTNFSTINSVKVGGAGMVGNKVD